MKDLSKAELAAIIGGLTASQIKKTSHAELVQMAEKARAKAPAKKRGMDMILFLPADSQKEPRAGSKRATIIDLLRATEGTTLDAIAAATGWKRDTAAAALYTDVRGAGFGIERRDGRLHLLTEGAK